MASTFHELPDSRVTAKLLRTYDVPAPRYTSYPTAVHFDDLDDDLTVARWLLEPTQAAPGPLSLYFHLPFCRRMCWYCACNKIITRDTEEIERYVDYLVDELDLRLSHFDAPPVVQLHFGGGTPTYLAPDTIRRLMGAIRDRFPIADDAEIAVEIDPRELTLEHVEALAASGFNRASIGVQDTNPRVQRAINRIQPLELIEQSVAWLRQAGFQSINFDLIYGLPHQSEATFGKTLDAVVELAPERLAVYGYAHVPWKAPAQKLLERAPRPDARQRMRLVSLLIERLVGAGYEHIGMDHFALPDDDLAVARREGSLRRNFQGYSTHDETDIHAFGVSAISQVGSRYFKNAPTLPAYFHAIDTGKLPSATGIQLSRDDVIRRHTIMRIMCSTHLDYRELSADLGIDFAWYFNEAIAQLGPLEDDGLVVCHPYGLEVTELGRFFLRNIAMCFDGYLRDAPNRYSTSV